MRISAAFLLVVLPLIGQTSLRQHDFKNAEYAWDDLGPPDYASGVPGPKWFSGFPDHSVRLRDGVHLFGEPHDGGKIFQVEFVQLNNITFGDLTGDGQPEAAVDLLYSTGGTANWHYLYVYTSDGGRPKLIGILMSGQRGYGGLADVSIENGRLVLEFYDGDRSVGDCCSRGVIRERYRFTNGRFIKTGREEKDSVRRVVLPILGNSEESLSPDDQALVSLRRVNDKQTEIWLSRPDKSEAKRIYAGDFTWAGKTYPSSSIYFPQWSPDGKYIYFGTDFTIKSGALWRLDLATRKLTAIILDAATYRIIQTGKNRGRILAAQKAPPQIQPDGYIYSVYWYYLFSADGKKIAQMGTEADDPDAILRQLEEL